MKLPNWFRIIWWIVVTGFTGYVFHARWGYIIQGLSAPVDVVIFIILVALLLVPIFQEVSLLGLKFKQEIESLKQHVSTQLVAFKADIQTVIANSVNTNVTVSSVPPPDDKLPKLEETIRETLREYLGEVRAAPEKGELSQLLSIDEKTQFLFRARYQIERNLREIADSFGVREDQRRSIPIAKITSLLIHQELLSPRIASAIREVYSVCSPAIHGEPFTEAQFDFVRDLGPEIVRTLEKIRAEQGV